MFPFILNWVQELGTKSDYPPEVYRKLNTTYMDVFMAIFMLCAVEVVLIKVMTFEEENDNRRNVANEWFENYGDS